MKKKSFISLLFICSILILSCKKELEPQESTGNPTPVTPVAEANAGQMQAPQNTPQNLPVMAGTPQPQAVNMPPQPVKTAPGMNPPHGQPNHRCDIAVGAPLNSLAAKANSQSTPSATITQATPSQTIQVGQPQNATPAILNPGAPTAPGMNPPHGQDGHRCDVAVGAPLPKV